MKYSELIEVMHDFRAGLITRAEMIAAFALWQRPVECARPFGEDMTRAAIEGIIRA